MLIPLPRAPSNVFRIQPFDTLGSQTGRQSTGGYRNIFELPISYDVNIVPGLLDTDNRQLIEASGPLLGGGGKR